MPPSRCSFFRRQNFACLVNKRLQTTFRVRAPGRNVKSRKVENQALLLTLKTTRRQNDFTTRAIPREHYGSSSLNLSRIRKSNNINLFCGVPCTSGPFRSFSFPSAFAQRLGLCSIDCSSASLFVSSDGIYARQRYPLREL